MEECQEDTDSYSSSLIFQTPSETLRDGDTCLDANTLRVTLATLNLNYLSYRTPPSFPPALTPHTTMKRAAEKQLIKDGMDDDDDGVEVRVTAQVSSNGS